MRRVVGHESTSSKKYCPCYKSIRGKLRERVSAGGDFREGEEMAKPNTKKTKKKKKKKKKKQKHKRRKKPKTKNTKGKEERESPQLRPYGGPVLYGKNGKV